MIEKIVTGIVLQKFIFEDEHMIKILTAGGNILSLKAKGLDKNNSKNRNSLNIFNEVEVEYFTSSSAMGWTGRLKTASISKEFLSNNEISLSIIDVTRNIILDTNDNSVATFNVLKKIISGIESNTFSFELILALMILSLNQKGYYIMINACVKCGSKNKIKAFSIYEGGLICERHEEAKIYELPPDTLKKLIEFHSLKDPSEYKGVNLTPIEVKKLKSMYANFFENQLGINLYSIKNI